MESRILLSSESADSPGMPTGSLELPSETADQSGDAAHNSWAAGCEQPWLVDAGDEQNSAGPGPDGLPDESLSDDACGEVLSGVVSLGNGIEWDSLDRTASVPLASVGWLEETGPPNPSASDVAISHLGNVLGQSQAVAGHGASPFENETATGSDSVAVGPLASGNGARDMFRRIHTSPGDLASPVSSLPASSQGADQGAGTEFPRDLAAIEAEGAGSRRNRGDLAALRFVRSEPDQNESGRPVLDSERESARRQLVAGDSATVTARYLQNADGRGFSTRRFGNRWKLPDQVDAVRGIGSDAWYAPDLVLSATLDLLTAVSAGFSGPQDVVPLSGRRESSDAEACGPQPRQFLSAVDKPAFTPTEGANESSRDGRISTASGRALQNSPGPASSQPPDCRGAAELDVPVRDDASTLPVASDHTVRSRLLHVIEPRGPPQDEGSLCPDIGPEAHSDLLERLKFSISPRGPSLTPASDAEFASVPSRSRR